MKKNIVIIGAGGHGRVCAEIAKLNGYNNIAFLDDILVHIDVLCSQRSY